MPTSYIIPLTPVPQNLGVSLAGTNYRFAIRWNNAHEGGWILSISSSENAAPLVCGIPFVAGCDLLGPYRHLNFGGELRISDEIAPTLENLGKDVRLVFTPHLQN